MTSAFEVTAIVLTFNRWAETRACLTALFAGTWPRLKVLVVDNGSTDETRVELPLAFPAAHLLLNETNLGYVGGNNAGLRLVLSGGSSFALVVNNDVIVAPDCVATLVAAAQDHPEAALFGPLIYHADEPEIIQSAGGCLQNDWHSYHRGANRRDNGQFHTIQAVDWLSGCVILARTRALAQIGILDSTFFMYGEDVDWGVRTRRAGWEVLFVPTARAWHAGVSRNYDPPPYVTYYTARNELQLMRKHHAGGLPLLRALMRSLRTLISWTLLPRWRHRRAHRTALVRALGDFAVGRVGPFPS